MLTVIQKRPIFGLLELRVNSKTCPDSQKL